MDTEQATAKTYIDEIAHRIFAKVNGFARVYDSDDALLYRIYAVLCLAKGTETTNKDVHDAWSAWMAGMTPDHRHLIPFHDLKPSVAALDVPYRDAIHAVARDLFPEPPKGY